MKKKKKKLSISHEHNHQLFRSWYQNPTKCKFSNESNYDFHSERNFIHSFSPFTNGYFSELNPLFSFELNYYDTISEKMQTILLRDGLYSLLWFFQDHKPNRIHHNFIVHSSFAKFIPNNWIDKIHYYSFYPIHRKQKISSLIISALFYDEYLNKVEIDKHINYLKKYLSKKENQNLSLEILCETRGHRPNALANLIYFINQFQKNFGEIKKIWTPLSIMEFKKFSNYKIYSMNSKKILADDYLNHYFCHHGAQLILDPNQETLSLSKKYCDVELSSNHGLRIFEPLNNNPHNQILPETVRLYNEMWKHFWYHSNLPWPPDYHDFINLNMDLN